MERRPVPGTPFEVSTLGLELDPDPVAPPAAARQFVSRLREARSRGITLFDLARARVPARAERLVASAFPEPDPEIIVRVGRGTSPATPHHSPGRPPREEGALGGVDRLRASLAETRARLGANHRLLVEVHLEAATRLPAGPFLRAVEELAQRKEIASWSLYFEPSAEVPGAEVEGIEVSQLSTELSLLDPTLVRALDDRAASHPTTVFARGPFAGGRLDGTRFATDLSERRTSAGPVDVRTLRAEFAPVLRLGFLTAGRQRTLAQAAIQYLLTRRWVVSVLVPVPRPERWTEILATAEAPSLSTEQVAGIEGEGDGTHA